MEKQNEKATKASTAKKIKKPFGVISKHKPPTEAEFAEMQKIALKEEVNIYEPIVFSDEWYEFSVFTRKFNVSAETANKWLKKGWLAYSLIGRFRLINKADIEVMLCRFRKSAFLWIPYVASLLMDMSEFSFV